MINGTGTGGFIFNSSFTPEGEYGEYNWCNMPHVRRREYVVAEEGFELMYVEVVGWCFFLLFTSPKVFGFLRGGGCLLYGFFFFFFFFFGWNQLVTLHSRAFYDFL